MRNLLILPLLMLVLTGCFGSGQRTPKVEIVDLDVIPVRLVDDKAEDDVKVVEYNMETKDKTEKVVKLKSYAGWYAIHPKTFTKIVNSALQPKVKVIVLTPEGNPISLQDDSEAQVEIMMVVLEGGNQIVRKVKVKDYRGWVVIHPRTYERLVRTGLDK